MAETIDLEFRANVADIKKKLKELPKDTAKAANKSVGEIVKSLKAMEKQAKKVEKAEKRARWEAKKLGDESAALKKRGRAGFEALKQAAEGVGGSVGGAAGMVEKFGRSIMEMGTALGPMGMAAVAASLAIGGIVTASIAAAAGMFQLVNAGDDWLKVLDEAGAADDLITDEQRRALEEANVSIDAMWLAAKRLGAVLAVEFADGIRAGADAVIVLASKLESAVKSSKDMGDSLIGWLDMLPGVNIKAMQSTTLSTTAFAEESEAVKRVRDAARELRVDKDELTKSTKKHTTAIFDEQKALEDIGRMMERGHAAELARGKAATAEIAALAAEEIRIDQSVHDSKMLNEQIIHDRRIANFQRAHQIGIDIAQDMADFINVTSEKGVERARFWEEQATQAHKKGDHIRGAVAEARASQQRKSTMRAFRAMKTLQRAAAVAQGAENVLSLIPFYSFLGPGAIPAALATAAPATAVQLARINNIQPPTFAAGGVTGRAFGSGSAPDHVTIQADPREGIVSPRGMDALGAKGLDQLNAGGGMGPTNITLKLDSATIAAVVLSPSVKRELLAELRAVTGAGRGISYGRG